MKRSTWKYTARNLGISIGAGIVFAVVHLAIVNQFHSPNWSFGELFTYSTLLRIVITGTATALLIPLITKQKELLRNKESFKNIENLYRELIVTDPLTKLFNVLHFYERLQTEVDRSNETGQPLTILILDLDNFKSVNDTYGHIEGDNLLLKFGQVVKTCLRKTDTLYRYGGDEFSIILPMATKENGIAMAERIRTAIEKGKVFREPNAGVTVSIGVAQHNNQEEVKSFIDRTDQIMYNAKKDGKNRISS